MASETKTDHVVTLTADGFDADVLQSDVPVLVDFWAEWCGPCRMIAPAVRELAEEFQGRAKVAKLDVDRYPEVAGRFGVQGIPALLFFQGGQIVDQVVGAVPKSMLEGKLQAVVEGS